MKIISLTSENIKKLSAVEIRPDGNLVQITGKNGQGKTSVLDSIWWALAGAANVQAAPIRRGETKARIRLDLGDIIVTRTFQDVEGEPTTRIAVETAEGARFPSPQKMLDGLLGALSFDPLAFTRMDARAQFNALRQFVPDVDFDEIDRANKRDYEARTDLNRQAKQARASAAAIEVPDDLPDGPVDEDAIAAQLISAGEHNSQVELRAERRNQAVTRIADLLARADSAIAELPGEIAAIEGAANSKVIAHEREIEELNRQIAALQDRIRRANDHINEVGVQAAIDVAQARKDAEAGAADLRGQAAALQAKLDAADELPGKIDAAELSAALTAARATNQGIRQREQRAAHLVRAEEAERASADLTAAMEAREAAKQQAIAGAQLPVQGIGFGDGVITLGGLPFEQASDAEQLRASIAIAMASNPKLRVIRVRDGSLLDEDGMRMLGEMADAYDCQVWVEAVRSDGKVGFVLEDGHIKGAEPQAAAKQNKRAGQTDLLGAA